MRRVELSAFGLGEFSQSRSSSVKQALPKTVLAAVLGRLRKRSQGSVVQRLSSHFQSAGREKSSECHAFPGAAFSGVELGGHASSSVVSRAQSVPPGRHH